MIIIDAISNSGNKTTTSAFTWSHTCTGSMRVLVVRVSIVDNSTVPTNTSVSGVTYNSVAMTKITSTVDTNQLYSSLWVLIGPSTGANTVSVTLNNTYAQGNGGALSVTGGALVQADASSSFTATIQNPSNSINTKSDNALLVDSITVAGSVTLTGPNAGQTLVDNTTMGTSAAGMSYRTGLVGTPGSTSMGWQDSASRAYTQSIASIIPSHPSFQLNSLRPAIFKPGLAR